MTSDSYITLFLASFVSFLLLVVIWKRRKLYYAASKLDGPFGLPFIGSILLFSGGHKTFYTKLKNVFASCPPLAKIWLGPHLFFITSRPEDVEIVLNNNSCLEKGSFYTTFREMLGGGLAFAPVDIWKKHRKLINPSFNLKILTGFHKDFVKHANNLVKVIDDNCGKGKFDLMPKFLACQLNINCESLFDVDSSKIKEKEDFLKHFMKWEDIVVARLFNPLLHIPFIWLYSSLYKEMMLVIKKSLDFVQQVVDLKRSTFDEKIENSNRKKIFLNNILHLTGTNQLTKAQAIDEINVVLLAGTESTSITMSFAMLILGILPHIQEKIYKELETIFEKSVRDPTEDDMNKMKYLEQVIKETLRLLTPAPMIARHISNDVKLSDGFVLPSGSNVLIPIVQMHQDPLVWPDPLKFDPDRFLPEEVEKRHKLSFIPFSYGVRNCIGFKYAMMSMKVVLSTILRKYKIVSVDYKSIEDIEVMFFLAVKPTKGCNVILEERIK